MLGFCLFLFSRELEDVREHDRRVTEEAETAQRDVSICIYNLSTWNYTMSFVFL